MKDLQKIIKDIDGLKPIPQVANKIISIVEDPDSTTQDLTEVIKYDQALTANLLKLCNSSYFGLPRRIDSLHHAITYLGMDQVADLVFLAGGTQNLKRGQKGYDLQEGELWKYSVSSALVAREVCEKKGIKNNHLVFTAALLKDIGKVVLNQYVAESIDRINTLVLEGHLSFREAEKEVIGIDHADLGGIIAEKWNFSPEMVKVIKNHHMSEESLKEDFNTSVVYLADTLCMMMGVGVGGDGLAYRFHREVVDGLGLSQRDVQEIMAEFAEKLRQIEELINLS